jgi:hypothetical protein
MPGAPLSPAVGLANSRWVTAAIAIVGLAFVVGPSIIHGRIPGDLGDARFITYILEHSFRRMTGQDASFWNAGFFYPFPLTIAFGDNFLGNSFLYAIFRWVGVAREDAFRLWYLTGFVINFAAAAYTLVRLGYTRFAAALGAFVFSFGLPVTAQEGHAQLIYRFGVPLAILALENFRSQPQLRQIALIVFWTTWQFYCSIYIGYFLTLLLGAVILGHAIWRAGAPLRGSPSLTPGIRKTWTEAPARAQLAFVFTLMVLAALMMLIWLPYVKASQMYGFQRQWSEIADMLPRPASYLLASNSRLWPSSGPWFSRLPMRHEHAMFIGAMPLLTIAIAVILRLANLTKLDELFAPISVAILLLFVLTLWIAGNSTYRVLTWLPGANAIRAVTRIITVLLFPCGILFASSLDAIARARIPIWTRTAAVAVLSIVTVFESSYVLHYYQTKHDWREREANLAAELPNDIPDAPILLLAPQLGDAAPWSRELDAMLFAQDRGWRTLNGYSGNSPPRPELAGGCQDAGVSLVSGLKFLEPTAAQDYSALARDVLLIGYPPCDRALAHPPQVTMFAGPLSRQLMGSIGLRIERLWLHDGRLVVTAEITNHASATLPAYSTTRMPIRLSPRFLESHAVIADLAQLAGWDARQPVGFDVPPGSSRSMVFFMPAPPTPGTYRVSISMVQDGVAWFHNHGMHIPISAQTVRVDADHTVHLSSDAS